MHSGNVLRTIQRALRCSGSAVGLAVAICFALSAGLGLSLSGVASAQDASHAGVVVQFDDHAQRVRSVVFSDTISGIRALELSGLDVVTTATSFGPTVCAIEGVGCPADDCFCNQVRYWGYNYWDGSAWQGYAVGAGSSVISQTGAVEGWRWGSFGDAQTPAPQATAVLKAFDRLKPRQVISDGSYGGVGSTVEMLLALGANGMDADAWRRSADAPAVTDYLTIQSASFSRSGAAAAGKVATALAGADACLPIGLLTPADYFSPTLGAYSVQSGPNAWAVLGALALSETVPGSAVQALYAQIQSDGGWEWAPGWGSDTNSTALAIQALVAAGKPVSATAIVSGLAYLKSAQNDDGGFAYAPADDGSALSDANSTAYVVQALAATGQDPLGPAWTVNANNPIRYLLSLQLGDGSFAWQAGTGSNQLATQQVIPALLGHAYPLQRAELAGCPGVYVPIIMR